MRATYSPVPIVNDYPFEMKTAGVDGEIVDGDHAHLAGALFPIQYSENVTPPGGMIAVG